MKTIIKPLDLHVCYNAYIRTYTQVHCSPSVSNVTDVGGVNVIICGGTACFSFAVNIIHNNILLYSETSGDTLQLFSGKYNFDITITSIIECTLLQRDFSA